MTAITTSTAATASAYSNQRKIDRTSNGVLWSHWWDGTSTTTASMRFAYSTDNGATWTDSSANAFGFGGTGTTYVPNASIFIDLDDYAHVVFKDSNNGYIYYSRGTPNAGRTAWTWSAAVEVGWNNALSDYADIVAHRQDTGWKVHMVSSYVGGSDSRAQYYRLGISSSGAVTHETVDPLQFTNHSGTIHKFPSIDFNHTGDGKTVAGGTPHLYVGWSAGEAGAGKGIRFRKATYAAGAWTWDTEREIDSTRYISAALQWLNCLFDGTRVLLVGELADADLDLVMYERDAADTATITRVLLSGAVTADRMTKGSASYDAAGNVYFFGQENASNGPLNYRKWTRSGAALGAKVVVDATGGQGYVSAKRGYSNNRIEFIYTDGTASPYAVTYDSIELVTTPYVPAVML